MKRLGVAIAAISVDSPRESRRVVDRNRLPFPILADESRDLVRTLGLLHRGGGPGGEDIAIPTLLLIDPARGIRWRFVSDRIQNRMSAGDVLVRVQEALQ